MPTSNAISEAEVHTPVDRVFSRFETALRLAGLPAKRRKFSDSDLEELVNVVRQSLIRSRNDERGLILNITSGFIEVWGKYYETKNVNETFFCFLCLHAMAYEINRTRFPLPSRFMMKRQIMVRIFNHLTSDDFIAMLLRDFRAENTAVIRRHLMTRADMVHVFNGIRMHARAKFRSMGLI